METLTIKPANLKEEEYESHDIFFSHRTSVDSHYNGKDDYPKVVDISSEIQLIDIDFDDDEFKIIGKIKAYKVSDLNGNHYSDLFSACDDVDSTLYEAFSACFKNVSGDAQLKGKKSNGIFDDMLPNNMILIDEMRIDENYRGKKIGSFAVKRFIEELGENSIIIVKPWDIENESEKRDQKLYNRVKSFWMSFGFKRLGTSDFYTMESYDLLYDSIY